MVPEDAKFCQECGTEIVVTPATTRYVVEQPKVKSKKKKTLFFALAALAALLAIGVATFFILNNGSKKKHIDDDDDDDEEIEEVMPVRTIDDSGAACADSLWQVLNNYNYVGDGARFVYAARATGSQPGVNDNIIGITQKTGEFYKIWPIGHFLG